MDDDNQQRTESHGGEMYYGAEGKWWKPEQWDLDSDGRRVHTVPYKKHPCYDTTDGTMPFGVQLQGVVIKARDRRIGSITRGVYSTDSDCYQVMTGYDVRNAMAVWHEAKIRGLNVRRVLGGVHSNEGDSLSSIESASTLLSTGEDHHWIEIQHPESGNWWTVVVALKSEGERQGTPYVGEVPPEEYVLYEDSRSQVSHRDLEHYLEMVSIDDPFSL